ncbi:TraX family protein [Anaerosacchariphilus polymeriproducens]|uniref:TraX protein n=1 Tax=Anaerosacchariphilus polymeriproducens TaxID=1812858 RepID=A0A371AUR4_9FIRM|nr:TraX family protein [Anaerosacchariphilus polymeriproducens]RDU23308.1 hypothetical protein DWV06_10405 [Anaerosacchariphilus polymeriproducens]
MIQKIETKEGCLSGFWLKIIAIVTMLIDHLGYTVFPQQVWMRYVGRIAFPIFCYLITEGFVHTKNVKKYSLRLLMFALISEIPYDLAFHRKVFYWEQQNVFFTLLLGLLCLIIIKENIQLVVKVLGVVSLIFAAGAFGTDYGGAGVLLIIIFYLFKDNSIKRIIAFFVVNSIILIRLFQFSYLWETNLIFEFFIQDYAILSLLPIELYNGERGFRMKWSFYLFYPIHLLLIYGIILLI